MKILVLSSSKEISDWLYEKGYHVFCMIEQIPTIQFVQEFDWIISYGYRHIIKQDVIDAINGNIINLHISYLPWNRGADPNFWSFKENTPKGVTIHKVDAGIDTGPILVQKIVEFKDDEDTLRKTYDRLQREIVLLFFESWEKIANRTIKPISQQTIGTFYIGEELVPFSVGSFHLKKHAPELFLDKPIKEWI